MNSASTRTPLLLLLTLLLAGVCPAETLRVDDAMYLDPAFDGVPPVIRNDPQLKERWVKALRRPEGDLKRLAADTITIAQNTGVSGLQDTTDDLLAVLRGSPADPTVQRAVAHALIALQAREAAEPLFEGLQVNGVGFAQVVEPALGRWGHPGMLQQWRQRLTEPATLRSKLLLAIRGLGAATDQDSSEALTQLVVDPKRHPAIRLSAARALAQIQHEGLSEIAGQLASSEEQPVLVPRILAATLLASHDDQQSITLLLELAERPEPVVAAPALARLLQIDPQLLFDLAPQAIASDDVQVRRVGARTLFEKADVEAVQRLAQLLDDHNPSLRRDVASWLFELAGRDELQEAVIAETSKVLSGEAWRGLEQACLILGTLDHEPAADRLVELMEFARDEVAVSAAWALRRLRISEKLPLMLDRAQLVKDMLDGIEPHPEIPTADGFSAQLSQLLQAFGEMRYLEADALMKSLVPKKFIYGGNEMLSPDPRAAAIWSLGYLYEGQAPEALSKQLAGRLTDQDLLVPEMVNVRRQSGVSLGRMKSAAQLGALRDMAAEDFIGRGSHWAINQITGEPIPAPTPRVVEQLNWFLAPLSKR